jgi:hypothetical protein
VVLGVDVAAKLLADTTDYFAGEVFGSVLVLTAIVAGTIVAVRRSDGRATSPEQKRRGRRSIIAVGLALVAVWVMGNVRTFSANSSSTPAAAHQISTVPSQTVSPATTPPLPWPTLRGYTPQQMATDPTFGGHGGITPIVGIRGTGPQTMPVGLTPAQITGSFGSSSGATVYLVTAGQQHSSPPIYSQTIAGSGGIFSDITTAGVYDLIVETAPGVHWTAILGHRPS